MNILVNTIGLFAIITWVLSIQNKNKTGILIYQLVANILYFIQYYLLNAYSACLMDFTSGIRCLFFYLEEKKHGKISNLSFLFFILLIIVIGMFTYNGIISLLPIIISLIYMYSIWQNNLNITRYLFIITAIIWIYYNMSVGAYINIIGNIFEILSGIISIIRFRRK